MATTRSILNVLDTYQRSRLSFAEDVAELASKWQNVEALHTAGFMQFLKPLLLDSVPQVQQTAALALGYLANYNEDLSSAVVAQKIHLQLAQSLKELDRYSKRPAAHVLNAVAKHTPALAQAVVDSGAVDELVLCLEEFDTAVKETGASALGHIARHTSKLAETVVNAGAVPLLVVCVQESELPLRRASVLALANIAKHSPKLAQVVVDTNTLSLVAPLINHPDARLKRQVYCCLSSVAKHSEDLAKKVVAANVFPKSLLSLKDTDSQVRRNASLVVREVCKHTAELASLVVCGSGAAAIVENVTETIGNERLPGIMALGYIAAFDEILAEKIIGVNGIPSLLDALSNEEEDHIKSASAWSLGQIGRHCAHHALAVAKAGVLPKLLSTFLFPGSSEDLRTKCQRALRAIISSLTHLPALDSLLQGPRIPDDITSVLVAQLAKILLNDPDARTLFVTSGGLEKLQKLHVEVGSELKQMVDSINACYPEEIVHYYSPGYSGVLLQKITESKPAVVAA
ncbi:hypothetical protein GOP47_0013439 [Adiantum capillus-veneris]|uniref:Sperm-associated antigen 6 n=1 Tax=Adiantum capillus-veneris TaxID=13818 RepID=A0A9D4UNI2_ADICA|nr:hypothetical protein GOP47_0013439 [Adiantum capillus-veneris]